MAKSINHQVEDVLIGVLHGEGTDFADGTDTLRRIKQALTKVQRIKERLGEIAVEMLQYGYRIVVQVADHAFFLVFNRGPGDTYDWGFSQGKVAWN
jgi:hypothetical protein